MVTVSFFLVFILLTSLVIGIDIFAYHYSFTEEWGILFNSYLPNSKIILYGTVAIGLLYAIIVDIRIMKKKHKKQTI